MGISKIGLRILQVAVVLFAVPALADDLDVQIVDRVVHLKDVPRVEIKVNKAIQKIDLKLKDENASPFYFQKGNIRAGRNVRFDLNKNLGAHRYGGELTVVFKDATEVAIPLDFSTYVGEALKLEVPTEDVDLKNRRFRFRLNEPVTHCTQEVRFDSGELQHQRVELDTSAQNRWIETTWDAPPDGSAWIVLKISLTCYDVQGSYRGIDLFPWRLDIPHEEVLFDSGQAVVLDKEAHKLTAAMEEINERVTKYSQWTPITLYVIGHTDRVGDVISNQKLSQRRASSIARYFKKLGLRIAIESIGRGESQPKVPTADDVAEAENRRVDYVLSNLAPFAGSWKSTP